MIWLALYLVFVVANAFWLRHRCAFLQRLNDCHWRVLTLGDENPTFPIFGLLYLVGLWPRRPMVGDTISALLWWGEQNGVAWCRPVRIAVDGLFLLLTGQHDHCRKAFQNWANPMGGLS